MNAAESPLRLLVVDDDELDRETVRRALRPMALEIVEATSGKEAEQCLMAQGFDCVLLDYLLPEGPSIDVIELLRERSPHTALVVLTGQGDEAVAVELMKAGAADYLSKDSLEPSRLRAAITFAVALRRAQISAARAKAERDHYAGQLRRFVERAPELVAARTLPTLCEVAAALAVDVLGAAESFVLLRGDERELRSGRGDEQTELGRWVMHLLEEQRLSSAPLRTPALAAVGLMARDGTCTGALAVRWEEGMADNGLSGQLLSQLGVLVSLGVHNLLSYDAAARAVRARDDVMAVVSHDLRTPLNNVRLGASLLRETADDKQRTVIERVERNVTLMTRLVDDLVDMVRIEGGMIELHAGAESVAELLEAARDLVAAQAATSEHAIEVRPGARPLRVRADRERVLQVLSNLLGNAVKFTPSGGKIALCASEHESGVCFEVRDSGPGISQEEGEKVFARFWRSDPRKRSGLGLGLYIAKGLVQAHGGTLWYESEPGKGTSFFFTLPRALDEARAEPGL